MTEDKAEISKAIFDERFGSLRHLSVGASDVDDMAHSVRKEAVELLLDALDCLHEVIEARKNGEAIDDTALVTLQRRLEGVMRMQRLLEINDADCRECPGTGSQIAGS